MTDTSFLSGFTGGAGIPSAKPVSITDVNSQNQLLDLKRKQAIAGLLLQQSQQPDATPNEISGHYVRKSPLTGLAKAAQMMMGVKMGADAEAEGVKLQKDALGRLLNAAGAGGANQQNPLGTQVQANEQSGLPWQTGQSTPAPQPPSGQVGGDMSPLAVHNMTPEQRAILLQIAPDEYMKAYAAQFVPTDMQKNDAYMGINPQQARALNLAGRAKDIGVAGGMPNLDESGNINISPIAGAVDTQAQMSGAVKRAEQQNTIQSNVTVNGVERPVWGGDIPRISQVSEADAIARENGGVPAGSAANISSANNFGKNVEIQRANADFMRAQGETLVKDRPDVLQSAQGTSNIHDMRKYINSPTFNGALSDSKLQLAKGLKAVGLLPQSFDDTIANTEAFTSLGAREVGNAIQAFGSGTGISDADREYAKQLAGGDIKLDKKSINSVLDIAEKVHLTKVNDFNDRVKRGADGGLKGFYDLAVEVPQYEKTSDGKFTNHINSVVTDRRVKDGKTYIQKNGEWWLDE